MTLVKVVSYDHVLALLSLDWIRSTIGFYSLFIILGSYLKLQQLFVSHDFMGDFNVLIILLVCIKSNYIYYVQIKIDFNIILYFVQSVIIICINLGLIGLILWLVKCLINWMT